jgi:hypothetical protein
MRLITVRYITLEANVVVNLKVEIQVIMEPRLGILQLQIIPYDLFAAKTSEKMTIS